MPLYKFIDMPWSILILYVFFFYVTYFSIVRTFLPVYIYLKKLFKNIFQHIFKYCKRPIKILTKLHQERKSQKIIIIFYPEIYINIYTQYPFDMVKSYFYSYNEITSISIEDRELDILLFS